MKIVDYSFYKINDPTGIMVGDRYEFLLNIEVDEEDELYTEGGLEIRVILAREEEGARLAHYNFIDKETRKTLEFALEEDEEQEILEYCSTRLP
ncbi:MAG TPA: DUF6509 family protein [Planococcus sp. (in: firmicutes)]|nr:DUF6509 family protein [Planococcus sp. (in: firmicutes)]